MKRLKRILEALAANFTPFLVWLPELRKPQVVKADVIAGTTVALVLVPQSMAYAQLAGLPPYYGLYASFLPVAIAAVFGSSRQLATGPVAVASLLTASALGPMAASGSAEYFLYAVTLALIVGVIQMILGLVRLGVMVAFLSHPVVIGFTNAAAIIIATSQLDKIFGVRVENVEHHYETVWMVLRALFESPHIPTLGIAATALIGMGLLRRFAPKLPDVLLVMVATIILAWWFDFEKNGGQVVGVIPQGLPVLEIPKPSFAAVVNLLSVAFTIALIGFIEAISIAKAMAARTRQRLDVDQELIGQGLSNITASFFQGYVVSGSFSRSAVNFDNGATTGLSSLVTTMMIGLTLLFLTPLLYHLPQPTLAAVIILAVGSLIRVKPLRRIWRTQRHDAIVALVTFLLTLLYAPHLEKGILAGVMLSLGLYVYRTMRPHISILARHEDGALRDAARYILQQCPQIVIIRFEGPLFFANTSYFETRVLERVASMPHLRFIIIDAVAINEIDATGEAMLHSLSHTLVSQNIKFLFVRVQAEVMDVLERCEFASPDWADHFLATRNEALDYAWSRLRQQGHCECPYEGCRMRDLSGCVLQPEPRQPSRLLSTLYGGWKAATKPAGTTNS